MFPLLKDDFEFESYSTSLQSLDLVVELYLSHPFLPVRAVLLLLVAAEVLAVVEAEAFAVGDIVALAVVDLVVLTFGDVELLV